jgi:hypothetical protein
MTVKQMGVSGRKLDVVFAVGSFPKLQPFVPDAYTFPFTP